jgi:vacuolar-type H+-ATPase subunit E/Vma4
MNPDVFRQTVMHTTAQVMAEAMKEIDAEYENTVKACMDAVKRQAGERLALERHGMETEKNKRITAARRGVKKELDEKRECLTASLFEEVWEGLREFANSAEYPGYMHQKIAPHDGEAFAFIQVMHRDKDMIAPYSHLTVIPTDEDFIGGFRLLSCNQNAVYDHTLAYLLSLQRDVFPALYNRTNGHG